MPQTTHDWVKGHGTRNDFILLPDEAGTRYPTLEPDLVRWLCDRNEGLGADGVIRVTKTAHVADLSAEVREAAGPDVWFMDYRNSDGSVSEMCGNGVRVLAHYLATAGMAELPLTVATRGGLKDVASAGRGDDGEMRYTVSMGQAVPVASDDGIMVTAAGVSRQAAGVLLPNPHAVVFVGDVEDAGPLREVPELAPASAYPRGANVEFVARRGSRWIQMRVHERGVGETLSCGTGACAAAWATMMEDGTPPDVAYRVDVPGGTLEVRRTADHGFLLTGPAVLTAAGTVRSLR